MGINMPVKGAQRITVHARQFSFFFFYSKTAKNILDIRGTSVFECHGDSLDLNPIQQVLNIINYVR